MVLDVSRKYLPSMAVGLDSPKLELNVGDGFEYLKNHKNEFDVIITDSSDPESKHYNLYLHIRPFSTPPWVADLRLYVLIMWMVFHCVCVCLLMELFSFYTLGRQLY